MNKLLKLMSAGLLALGVLFLLPGIGSADAAVFMKIGDIKGESTDNEHKDWIIIESMSSPLSEEAATSGRQHKPLVITKAVDKASPLLQRANASGQKFPEVIISVGEQKGRKMTYMKYKLKDVIVTSYQTGATGADAVPTEEVTFYYNKIEFMYEDKPARNKDRDKRK